jgi:hypothetical protein
VKASSGAGALPAIRAINTSSGAGLHATSTSGNGVWGVASATLKAGVVGTNSVVGGVGVSGVGDVGVYGSGATAGGSFEATATSGDRVAVRGSTGANVGVSSPNVGMLGYYVRDMQAGVYGSSYSGAGVFGTSTGDNGVGVVATNTSAIGRRAALEIQNGKVSIWRSSTSIANWDGSTTKTMNTVVGTISYPNTGTESRTITVNNDLVSADSQIFISGMSRNVYLSSQGVGTFTISISKSDVAKVHFMVIN